MNRTPHNKPNNSIPKNSYTQSRKLNQSFDATTRVTNHTPTHFLNVNPSTSVFMMNGYSNSKNAQNSKFNHHFASSTQLISNPFQTKTYVPPHLNSSQVFKCITSECQNWQIRPSTSKPLNYSSLYNNLQARYQKAIPCGSRLRKWTAGSKIKTMVYEDRIRSGYQKKFGFDKPYKLYVGEKSCSEDDDGMGYMNDTERGDTEQEEGNDTSERVRNIGGNQSRIKEERNLVQTQV